MSDTFDPAAHAAATEAAAAQPAEETRAPAAETQAPSDQTTEAPDTSGEQQPDDPTDAPETPSRGDKRVQQLLAERHALRERLAYLQGMAEQGQRPEPANQPQQQVQQPLPQDLAQWIGEEPKPETFPAGEFDPQYLRAIARFEARSEQAQMLQMQRAQASQQAQNAQVQAILEQAEKATKEKPDFREVAGGLGARLANWQANLVAQAGTEVTYAIGKDAEAEASIRAARNPMDAARIIGRIEARLERGKEPPAPRQPTSAPEPAPRAVRGGNAGTRAPAEMPMGEYAAWRAKQTWD